MKQKVYALPKSGYDYFEKDGDMWVHVYEIKQGRVYFNIADKDWTNHDVTIEEFMDKYNTNHPLTNEE